MRDPSKSQVEFYLDLCTQLVRCDPLGTAQSKMLKKDVETLRSRTLLEGLSFLTKTLPKLGKALDQGLISSRLSVPREFKRSHRNRSIPAFLQAYFSLVFDASGALLEEADAMAIRHIRQVCFFAYKLELPYSESEVEAVLDNFIRTDSELEFVESLEVTHLLDEAAAIASKVFQDFDPDDITPRHGPGAVATGEKLEDKWLFSRKYSNIHRVYPYYRYFIVGGGSELLDRLGWYKSLEPHESGVAKVVLVPKDSRGPRLISCEPLEYQWIQQGLGRKLANHLERESSLTRWQVNFTHQSINQQLAKSSSTDLRFATLDLKDASDRVSLQVVRRVFESTPRLLRALEACRTTATTLPDGRVLTLKKFAPMGSALCFPVEAFIFWAVIVAANSMATHMSIERVGKLVYVYGDDIVVPTEWAERSMRALEAVGLRVNRDKSCFTGFFRESCGVDAWKGTVVTPTRLRKLWSGQRTDGTAYAAYVSLANALSEKGYRRVSDAIWKKLEEVYGYVPYGLATSSFPCRIVPSPDVAISRNSKLFRRKWNSNLQRFEFRIPILASARLVSRLDDWPRLLRDQVSPPIEDPSVVVRPRSTSIKRGWAAVV